jgi:hypothetical protein
MNLTRFALSFTAISSIGLVAWSAGCSGGGTPTSGFQKPPGDTTTDASLDDASLEDTGTAPPLGDLGDGGRVQCVNLQCQQVSCGAGATTTVSGTVFDPAGKVPLYNVIVYVPNAKVEPFKTGATCDQCGALASGSPIVTALTDSKGNFVLKNVPAGANIPLVIQVGKWRRQVTIPNVTACKDNPITDKNLTRLPRNQKEGDMPQMALTTGGCDALECLFRKIGIDDSEFTSGTGTGRMHIYQGDSGATVAGSTLAETLWSDVNVLKKYDMTLFSCECSENRTNKPAPAFAALHDYASQGGRVFGTHYHYVWLLAGPSDFQSTAHYTANGSAGGVSPFTIDQSFPKGQAFADWLVNVGASTTKGEIELNEVAGDVTTVNAATSQQWIYSKSPQSAKYLSFNTPVTAPVAQQCGRVVYSDLHVAAGDTSGGVFPSGCMAGDLTAQEKALEFLFFDLSACVQDPGLPPPNPPVK